MSPILATLAEACGYTAGWAQFYVPGHPSTKGSWRPIHTKTGRVFMAHNNPAAYESWCGVVKQYAASHVKEPCAGPVDISLVFFLNRPKAHHRANGELKPAAPPYPMGKPDVDKLARLILDALTGIAWKDDAQVVKLTVGKSYTTSAPAGSWPGNQGEGVLITLATASPEAK